MLAGLSRCWTRRMPPGFWASAAVAIVIPNRSSRGLGVRSFMILPMGRRGVDPPYGSPTH
jgi:hypothetical protein